MQLHNSCGLRFGIERDLSFSRSASCPIPNRPGEFAAMATAIGAAVEASCHRSVEKNGPTLTAPCVFCESEDQPPRWRRATRNSAETRF